MTVGRFWRRLIYVFLLKMIVDAYTLEGILNIHSSNNEWSDIERWHDDGGSTGGSISTMKTVNNELSWDVIWFLTSSN